MRPWGGCSDAQNQAQQRGFAAAGLAADADEFALFDIEIDAASSTGARRSTVCDRNVFDRISAIASCLPETMDAASD